MTQMARTRGGWPEACASCGGAPCRYEAGGFHDPTSHYFSEEHRPASAPPHARPVGGFHWKWYAIICGHVVAEVTALGRSRPMVTRRVAECASPGAAEAALRLLITTGPQ